MEGKSSFEIVPIGIFWDKLERNGIVLSITERGNWVIDTAIKAFVKYMANETIFDKYEIDNKLFRIICIR